MKTRWYRRIGGKHVKFNLSKSGVSTSFKLGPVTINPQRNRYSINTPVKGLSLRGKLSDDEAINNIDMNEAKKDIAAPFVELKAKLNDLGYDEFNNLINGILEDINTDCEGSFGFKQRINSLEKELRNLDDIEFEDKFYDYLNSIKKFNGERITVGLIIAGFILFLILF